MSGNATQRGNNPDSWQKLMTALDEKLQLGLLDYLRRVSGYHFENDNLYIEPGSKADEEYLKRESVFQQLNLLAQDAINVREVRITKLDNLKG
jgi:hypothetical protein